MSNEGFPVIDTDPTFSRVVRYFRPSDLAWWGGATAAMPGLLYLWERIDFSGATKRQLRSGIRLNTALGFCGGFLIAYQNSSLRFWGWTENSREVVKDKEEMEARVKAGLSVYGDSTLTPYMQGVAARNSTYAAANLAVLPWFNVVNHPYHGVDTSKYGEQKAQS